MANKEKVVLVGVGDMPEEIPGVEVVKRIQWDLMVPMNAGIAAREIRFALLSAAPHSVVLVEPPPEVIAGVLQAQGLDLGRVGILAYKTQEEVYEVRTGLASRNDVKELLEEVLPGAKVEKKDPDILRVTLQKKVPKHIEWLVP